MARTTDMATATQPTDMATATQPTDMAMAPATVMDIRRDGSRSHSCEAGDGLGTNAVRQWGACYVH